MRTKIRNWLNHLPISDPLQRRQAELLQTLLVIIIAGCLCGLSISALSDGQSGVSLRSLLYYSLIVTSSIGAFVLLRRGSFTPAVLLASTGIIVTLSLTLLNSGLQNIGGAMLAYSLPVTLAGLMIGRRGLLFAVGLSVALVAAIGVLQLAAPTLVGTVEQAPRSPISTIATFTLLIGLLSLFLERFGNALRNALQVARTREQQLEQLQASMETTIAERTAALQGALSEVQARAEAQARLLSENEQQRIMIRELSVPVIPVSATTMVMPLIGTLDSARLRDMQTQALQVIERASARYLVLDITGVVMIDSQVAQGVLSVVQAARLLGSEVLMVGIRPEVAQTIVGLGLDLRAIRTFGDLQSALSRIQEREGVDVRYRAGAS